MAMQIERRLMERIVGVIIPALWLGWLMYWFVASRDVKETRWRESPLSQALHRVPLVLAAILLAGPRQLHASMTARVLPQDPATAAAGTAAVAVGLGFATWARVHLGRNWSAAVTLKESHALIRSGPYRYVRHPIYSGVLLALLGTAAAIGEWRAWLAVAVALVGIAHKIVVEEKRMRETFPEYEQYRRETAALIPFVL